MLSDLIVVRQKKAGIFCVDDYLEFFGYFQSSFVTILVLDKYVGIAGRASQGCNNLSLSSPVFVE